MATWHEVFRRNQRRIEWFFFGLTISLFLFSLADWLNLIPYDGFQPRRMVLLASSLAMGPVAALLPPRRRWLSYPLLVASMALLVAALLTHS